MSLSIYLAFNVEFNIWLKIMKFSLLMFPPKLAGIALICGILFLGLRCLLLYHSPIKCHKYNVFRKETPPYVLFYNF